MTTFYLVRHGETRWNLENRWQGQSDSALTEKGVQQITDLAEKLREVHFDALYSSDLPRAVTSANILNQQMKIELHTSKLLRERQAGPVEGTTTADRKLQPHIHDVFHAYLQLQSADQWDKKPFPDFESNQEVAIRFETELLRLADEHHNQTLLIVAHGGNIRNFLAHIGAIPKLASNQWRLANAAQVVVTCEAGQFSALHLDQLIPRLKTNG